MEGGGSSKLDWGGGPYLIKGVSFDKKVADYKPASTKNLLKMNFFTHNHFMEGCFMFQWGGGGVVFQMGGFIFKWGSAPWGATVLLGVFSKKL